MRETKWYIFLLGMIPILLYAENNSTDRPYLLQSNPCASNIGSINYDKMNRDERLLAVSLQGLINRKQPRIYLRERLSDHLLTLYKEKGIIKKETEYTALLPLLKQYKGEISGAIVYDPEKTWTINLASNIASVEDRIIISPRQVSQVRQTGISDIKNIKDFGFKNECEAFDWYMANIFPKQYHSILSVCGYEKMHDIYRDYLICFRIPTFWLPGKKDPDYNPEMENRIIRLWQKTPVNIPVIGFWPATESGYEEYEGVQLAGKYGKFTIVNTWVGNYSFHSGTGNPGVKIQQHRLNEKKQFDPTRKYVALTMIESGDAIGYIQYGLGTRQWDEPERGQVPISIGITPAVQYLMPCYLEHLFRSATTNEYFFCSISGAGYCYPLEQYASETQSRSKTLSEYFEKTATLMQKLDLSILGLYSHPNRMWDERDLHTVSNYILPQKQIKSILSDMGRCDGYTGKNANDMLNANTSIHHILTRWSTEIWPYDDRRYDKPAADWLIREIREQGKDGNFLPVMFYSWHYGPRRLKIVKDTLEKEGYLFVTLDEFDRLFREATYRYN